MNHQNSSINLNPEDLLSKIQELEQVIQSLVNQDSIVDKQNILQNYVLISSELERVSLVTFDLQQDNIKLAKTCQHYELCLQEQEKELVEFRQIDQQIRAEHSHNVNKINDLIYQNDSLSKCLEKIHNRASQNFIKNGTAQSEDKINLLLAINQKLEFDVLNYQKSNEEIQQNLFKLESEKNQLNYSLAQQKKEIDSALNEMQECEQMYRNSINQQKNKLEQLEINVQQLKEKSTVDQQKIAALLKLNDELQQVLTDNNQEWSHQQQDFEQRISSDTKFKSEQVRQKQFLDQKLDEYRRENEGQKAQIFELSKQLQSLKETRSNLSEQVQTNEQNYSLQINSLKIEFQSVHTNLRLKITQLEEVLNTVQQQSQFQQEIIQQLKKQRLNEQQTLIQENQRQEAQLTQQQKQIENMENELVSVTTDKDQMSLKLRLKLIQDQENENLLQQVASLRQDTTKMKQIIIDLTDSLNKQKNLFHQTQKDLINQKDLNQQLSDEKTNLQVSLHELQGDYNKIQEVKLQTRIELKEIKEEFNKVTEWNRQLHEQVSELVSRNYQLNQIVMDGENRQPLQQKRNGNDYGVSEAPDYQGYRQNEKYFDKSSPYHQANNKQWDQIKDYREEKRNSYFH